MKTRFIALLLMFAFVGIMTACRGDDNEPAPAEPVATPAPEQQQAPPDQQETTDPADASGIDLSEHVTITFARRGGPLPEVTEHDYFAELLLERFNMTIERTDIPNADFPTVMNLNFIAGTAHDVSGAHRPDWSNDWIEAGHLRGFTREEIETQLPNFVAHYAPGRWDTVWASTVSPDGLLHRIHGRRAQDMNMAWLYRSDLLDELGVDTFPNCTEELFDLLVMLRDHTGYFPIVEADPDTAIWAFAGWLQAFGMPELAARDISMIDPLTGEFVPFIFTTEQYRDVLRFLNRLFEEGLMWPEFATGNADQRNALMAQGHRHVIWGWPDQIYSQHNELSRTYAGSPDANWRWSRDMISATPDSANFFKMDPFHAADGTGFYVGAPDLHVERFMYFTNWLYSEEGMVWHTFGVEGIHHTVRPDGLHTWMDHMNTPVIQDRTPMGAFGFFALSPWHHDRNTVYIPLMVELNETFVNRPGYYYHVAPIIHFTESESRDVADVQTIINQARDTYFARFIMGHVDINNDADWNAYISTLNGLGLERLIDIRTQAFHRTPQP